MNPRELLRPTQAVMYMTCDTGCNVTQAVMYMTCDTGCNVTQAVMYMTCDIMPNMPFLEALVHGNHSRKLRHWGFLCEIMSTCFN